MDRAIRLLAPLVATALIWGSAFLGIRSFEGTAPEPDPVAQVMVVETAPDLLVPRLDESSSGFATVPQRIRTCELQPESVQSFAGTLSGVVVDGETGQQLLSIVPDAPAPTASVVKVFTAVAALKVLGPDYRFTTEVVEGEPGEIFLVGSGDVTLTRAPGGNYYDSEASLLSLAEQTAASANPLVPLTVKADGSRYEAFPTWDSSWRSGSAALGFIAPVTALQVDGDRDQPAVRLSPRSMSPESRAIGWFADALRVVDPARQVLVGSPGPAPQDGRVVATVQSAPLDELIGIMLVDSDNSLAEVLAREVALALGESDIGLAIAEGAGIGADVLNEVSIRGGSGLSDSTAIPHEVIAGLLGEINQDNLLRGVKDGLPVAGESGSLRNRFPR